MQNYGVQSVQLPWQPGGSAASLRLDTSIMVLFCFVLFSFIFSFDVFPFLSTYTCYTLHREKWWKAYIFPVIKHKHDVLFIWKGCSCWVILFLWLNFFINTEVHIKTLLFHSFNLQHRNLHCLGSAKKRSMETYSDFSWLIHLLCFYAHGSHIYI